MEAFAARTAGHKIAAHHEQLFQALGYVCDPDRKLTLGQADANWYALEFASLKEECRVARSQLLSIEQSLRGGRFAELQANLQQSQSQCQQLRAQIEDLRAALADAQREFRPVSADQQLNDSNRRASFSSRSAYCR